MPSPSHSSRSSASQSDPWQVVTIGAAFSANKGAASMLHAVLEQVGSWIGPFRADVLTTYPHADSLERLRPPCNIVSAKPRQILFPMLPLALMMGLLRLLRLPWRWLALTPAMRSIARADVVLDLAGISFVDGRGIPVLAYNTLMTGIPKLAGAKVVKCSQALGPFRQPLNRLAAHAVLPRLEAICARGPRTYEHLVDLGITGAVEASDLAFLMQNPPEAESEAASLLDSFETDFVAMAPSAVVHSYCEDLEIDYPSLFAQTIDFLNSQGISVVLFPHSYKQDAPASRMNDGPLCRDIMARVSDDSSCLLLDVSLPPTVLRAIIGRSKLLVTSRFHAMISALSTEVPPIVMGWSHKYGEVMGDFGLDHLVFPYRDLDYETITGAIGDALAMREAIVDKIRTGLPRNTESALRNFDEIDRVLTDR